ncbi:MAG: hypothetical protein ACE37F_20905 [Nannocystaceae bacterium]|nr:hypothetical protein [bacterium]
MKRNTSLFFIASVALLASACVVGPHNDDWVDPWAVDFSGYAEDAGDSVQIQAYDKHTNTWVTVRTVTASSTATNYGGETLYRWTASNTNTWVSGSCIWGDGAWANCPIPAGSAYATFRVRESGGRIYTTFDDGGVNCVIDEVSAGENWLAAGAACASPESPVLTLRWLT